MSKDIPGFFYDPEKRRYFRLREGHNKFNPLTFDAIKRKEDRQKRIAIHRSETRHRTKNSCHLLHQRQLHGKAKQTEWKQNRFQTMRGVEIASNVGDSDLSQINLNPTETRLFTIGRRQQTLRCYDVIRHKTMTSESPLKLDIRWGLLSLQWPNGGSVAIRPKIQSSDATTAGIAVGNAGPVTFFTGNGTLNRNLYDLFPTGALSCAWQQNPTRPEEVAVGYDGHRTSLIDVESGACTTKKLAPFARRANVTQLAFSAETSTLFVGCANERIHWTDVRDKTNRRRASGGCAHVVGAGRIDDIRPLRGGGGGDDRHVVVLGSAKFGLLDVRLGKFVVEYGEHVATCKTLRFGVDSTEQFVWAPGGDRVVRLWNVRRADLVKEIVPEMLSDVEPAFRLPPVVACGDNLGGPGGPLGLLVASKPNIYAYVPS